MELSFKSPFKERRQELICKLIAKHGEGIVLLISDLEDHVHNFLQDSTFYYFSGISEPGTFITILKDQASLWVPNFKNSRSKWVESEILPNAE